MASSPPGVACASCGRVGDDPLEPVRRVYLRVDEEGRVTGAGSTGGVERWCPSCRSLYPHRVGEPDLRSESVAPGPPPTSSEP